MSTRTVQQIVKAINTSEGAGVKLKRAIGNASLRRLDPFLLLDEFKSEKGVDYIAGFPSHPHRGFETVTYMLHGKMQHKDNAGNEGVIESGGVQWMTAGKGIIHSEMPLQQDGLMWGFQLWVNLPARLKMTQPRYQDIPAADVPFVDFSNGTKIRVIAGEIVDEDQNIVRGCVKDIYTKPLFLDVFLKQGQEYTHNFSGESQGFVYTIEGEIDVDGTVVPLQHLGALSQGKVLHIVANENSRFLLIDALPLNEPVVQHGPFVMNTEAEIRQAFIDYQSGKFQS